MLSVSLLVACGGGVGESTPTSEPETLGGGSTPTSEPETLATSPDVPFEITPEAEGQGNQINVSGATNLPDGTQVTLTASRAFRGVGRTVVQAANVGRGLTTVSDGSFAAVLSLGLGPYFSASTNPQAIYKYLDNDVTVCAEVQTGTSYEGDPRQPSADIRAVLGVHGEALTTSPQAMSFGSSTPTPSTWLEVEMTVALSPDETGHLESVNEAQSPTQAKLGDLQGHCVG